MLSLFVKWSKNIWLFTRGIANSGFMNIRNKQYPITRNFSIESYSNPIIPIIANAIHQQRDMEPSNSYVFTYNIETDMLSFWLCFHHWQHRRLSKWQFRQWQKFHQNDICDAVKAISHLLWGIGESEIFEICLNIELGILEVCKRRRRCV